MQVATLLSQTNVATIKKITANGFITTAPSILVNLIILLNYSLVPSGYIQPFFLTIDGNIYYYKLVPSFYLHRAQKLSAKALVF